MARPLRKAWRERTMVRRRHRTWMLSMSLATVGWAVWWVALCMKLWFPGAAPNLFWTGVVSGLFAVPGLGLAVFTLRARRTWLLFCAVPMFANASILMLPWLIRALDLRVGAG